MKVLVTGATGLVGNNVVRLLCEQGIQVHTLVRKTADSRPLADLDVKKFEGDVREPRSIQQAMQGVDHVIHAAAYVQIGWSQLATFEEINVSGTRHVLDAARASGCRLVYVSTINTLGVSTADRWADEQWVAGPNIDCPYVVTKIRAEQSVLEEAAKGLEAVVVNPALMFGPWDWKPSSGRMILEVAKAGVPFSPPGGSSVCDVRDVAQGVVAALRRGRSGKRYVLGGENITYFDLWCLIADATGTRRPRWKLGPVLQTLAGGAGDLWGKVARKEPELNSAAIKISTYYHYFSSRLAEEELGYTYRPARESIAAAKDWFQQQGYLK